MQTPDQSNELAAAKMELDAVKRKMVEYVEANKKLKAENSSLIQRVRSGNAGSTVAAANQNRTATVTPDSSVISNASSSAGFSGKTYTVQKGDNLTKISRKVFNDTKHVNKIRELNQDILKGKDAIQVGQVLKMPEK